MERMSRKQTYPLVMERMSRKQTYHSTTQSGLAMNKESRTISKEKPKIRIIHIFAPEIIKTDVENFRELVQRLTGKPKESGCQKRQRKKDDPAKNGLCERSATMARKMELRAGLKGLGVRERLIKEEEGMWAGENSGGFLSEFSDLEGFIQDYSEFPLFPLEPSQIHCFEGTQFS